MTTNADIQKDYEDAYNLAIQHWQGWLDEAERDAMFYAGDQWSAKWKEFLAKKNRLPLVFNKARRIIKLVSNYLRREQHAMRIAGHGEEDDEAARQITDVIHHYMSRFNGYEVVARAFEMGPCVTGLNMVEPYFDHNDDIRLSRVHYNHVLLDPAWTKPDLSDCSFMFRARLVTDSDMRAILPAGVGLEDIPSAVTAPNLSTHFSHLAQEQAMPGRILRLWEEFWVQRIDFGMVLYNALTDKSVPWDGSEGQTWLLQNSGGVLTLKNRPKISVVRHNFLDGHWFYSDNGPIDTYPYVPMVGDYIPEIPDSALRLQGLMRSTRDPQTAFNMRMSQITDMFESQIGGGRKVRDGSLVDMSQAWGSGSQTLVMTKGASMDDVQENRPHDVPPGLFQLASMMDQEILQEPGINEEMMGTSQKDLPGITVKLRQAGALTVLQDLYSGYRSSMQLLGQKMVKMIAMRLPPGKVQRITNRPPDPAIYVPDFDRYDCVVEEALMTDSQRESFYYELIELKGRGAPVPWPMIFQFAPVSMKKELMDAVASADQQQQQVIAQQLRAGMQAEQLTQSKARLNIAESQAKLAEATRTLEKAPVERQKIMAQTNDLKTKSALKIMELAIEMERVQNELEIARMELEAAKQHRAGGDNG